MVNILPTAVDVSQAVTCVFCAFLKKLKLYNKWLLVLNVVFKLCPFVFPNHGVQVFIYKH